MKILVVDDHPIVRAGLRRLLAAEAGFDVREAASGREALSGFREYRPDLVVLDLMRLAPSRHLGEMFGGGRVCKSVQEAGTVPAQLFAFFGGARHRSMDVGGVARFYDGKSAKSAPATPSHVRSDPPPPRSA